MGTSPDQARQAVAASRGRIEAGADRLEARLRFDLDPKRRLRRDGPKLAAGLAAVLLVGAVYLVRARRRRGKETVDVDWVAEMPREWRERLQELLAEAAERRPVSIEMRRATSAGRRSLRANLALRAARMAAPVIISAVAERVAGRQGQAASGAVPVSRRASPSRWWRDRGESTVLAQPPLEMPGAPASAPPSD